jgi:hypothetical protein
MATAAYIGPEAVKNQLGDMTIASSISLDAIAANAAGEMNIAIGERYLVPLNLDAPALLSHHRLMIELINARLAAGRFLLSQTSPVEDHDLWAYGKYLVDLAQMDIDRIVSGRVILGGQTDSTSTSDLSDETGPMVSNHDSMSAVTAFEESFMRGNLIGQSWGPGEWS